LSQATIKISCEEAEWEVEIIERGMRLLPDSAATYYEWLRIATQFDVRGLQVHDARLVAAWPADLRRAPGRAEG
jgi:hypothetical protein